MPPHKTRDDGRIGPSKAKFASRLHVRTLGRAVQARNLRKDLAPQEMVAVPAALLGFADFHDDLVDRLFQAVSQRLEVRSHQGVPQSGE